MLKNDIISIHNKFLRLVFIIKYSKNNHEQSYVKNKNTDRQEGLIHKCSSEIIVSVLHLLLINLTQPLCSPQEF